VSVLSSVGSINTYLGLIKDEQEIEAQPPALAQPSMQVAQNRILLLSVLSGNPVGLALTALQSFVGNSMPADVLRDSVSELRKKGLAEVVVSDDPLNPLVKITPKGQDQLSVWM
jgi:hypothetical protein